MMNEANNEDDDESNLIPNDTHQNGSQRSTNLPKETFQKTNSPSWLLPIASLVASLGGVLFGYDIGIISGAILLIKKEFMLTLFQKEMIITTLIIGGLFGSLSGGFLLDRYGRKTTIILNAFIFLIGAAVLTLAPSFYFFIVGRFILGFAVSLSAVGDCVYISEIAPPHKRGFLVSLNELGITFGILLAYLVNFLFIDYANGWRIMFGISGIPALVQAVSMFYLPASPRWLITKDREKEAEQLIQVLWPFLDSKKQLNSLKMSLSNEKSYRFLDLFTTRENLRFRMFIGCGIVLFQQLTGQPTVIYYAPILFQTLGFNGKTAAVLATVGLGVVKFLFTLISLRLVDRLGRRTFLLLGAFIITVSLITLTGLTEPIQSLHAETNDRNIKNLTVDSPLRNIYNLENLTNKDITTLMSPLTSLKNVNQQTIQRKEIPDSIKYTSLFALMMFVVGYSVGYGPMSWLVLTEIFPTGIKGRAVALASSVNWGSNIIISISFLDVLSSFGPFWTFFMYALIAVISIFFLCHFVPETKGKSLEQMSKTLINRKFACSNLRCCAKGHIVLVEEDENDWLLDDEEMMSYNAHESLM